MRSSGRFRWSSIDMLSETSSRIGRLRTCMRDSVTTAVGSSKVATTRASASIRDATRKIRNHIGIPHGRR